MGSMEQPGRGCLFWLGFLSLDAFSLEWRCQDLRSHRLCLQGQALGGDFCEGSVLHRAQAGSSCAQRLLSHSRQVLEMKKCKRVQAEVLLQPSLIP